ncbi:uncharacterized protein LOC133190718 [Saccostrea echinata]|uniref:uncharacterized protein LOC133190718 n=1 Tax=Saccostrea echinata TaxID=191078 RepID=UPI002A84088F|nr:uncharacterized protein LOC133190718 [Saccostrea echinata]
MADDAAMEEKLLAGDEVKKDTDTMDTTENAELVEVKKDDAEEEEEEKGEKQPEKREEENTLLTNAIKGPIRLSVVLIKDLSNHDLHQVLHRCSKATLEMERRRGVLTLWFDPWRSIGALAILKKLAKLQLSGEDFKMECPKALASMLGSQKIKEKYPDAKFGNKNKTLYVHDIPQETTEEVLRAMFPDVSSVNMPVDKEGKKLGVAILDFISGKDCAAALERNPAVLIGETNCTVDWYFPAPEDADEPQEKHKKNKEQSGGWRKRNRGGGGGGYGGGGYHDRDNRGGRRDYRGGQMGGGGYGQNYMMKQEKMNQMLMNQMQNLASMVGGGPGGPQGYGGNPPMSQGGGYGDYDQGFGDNFGSYQSGYYADDDYSAPNKRMRGNRNRRGNMWQGMQVSSRTLYCLVSSIFLIINKNVASRENGGWSTDYFLLANPGPCTVEVRKADSLSQEEFIQRYAYTKPVIIQHATDNSKFYRICEKDSMLEKYGSKKIRLSSANTHSYDKRDVTLKYYVENVMRPQTLKMLGNETFYWFGDNNYTEWRELFNQYNPPPYQLPRMTGAYSFGVAGAGTGVPFHFHGPGFGEVIFGRKRWFLYPPEKTPSFHPNRTTLQWLIEDYPKLHPEDYPLDCTINQGEIIYFPDRWWHGTLNIDTSVFISTFLG